MRTSICLRMECRIRAGPAEPQRAAAVTFGKISSGWFMSAFFGESRLKRLNSSFSLNDTWAMLPFLIERVFGNLRVHSSLPRRVITLADLQSVFELHLTTRRATTGARLPPDRVHIINDALFSYYSQNNRSSAAESPQYFFAEITRNLATWSAHLTSSIPRVTRGTRKIRNSKAAWGKSWRKRNCYLHLDVVRWRASVWILD